MEAPWQYSRNPSTKRLAKTAFTDILQSPPRGNAIHFGHPCGTRTVPHHIHTCVRHIHSSHGALRQVDQLRLELGRMPFPAVGDVANPVLASRRIAATARPPITNTRQSHARVSTGFDIFLQVVDPVAQVIVRMRVLPGQQFQTLALGTENRFCDKPFMSGEHFLINVRV